ncbi:alpha/beta fold hydrolase [Rhodococcus sp. 3Y1]
MTAPVLLIAGELDDLMTPERIRSAAEFLPHAEVVELADRGHSPISRTHTRGTSWWRTSWPMFVRAQCAETPTRHAYSNSEEI